ncbi:MAG: hypothetical protein JWM35_168 [Verrucomicrobia bacterium]|nr:hypothetical protein [Verrucomicrobiota bacterium]
MSLGDWANAGWLKPHKTSRQQIADLLSIVDRDLEDADRGLSPDWQFGIAYNAALKLCTVMLYVEGWRPEKNLAHYRTLQSMPLILSAEYQDDADYLDACRTKRNVAEYDAPGRVSAKEARELAEFVEELRHLVIKWLRRSHPEFAP